ncbi:unnamed protein product [Arabidopsis thaliana]|uniref:Uncharacterized protein n=1 Tax=Arabidopsis thaliana TaxID=3702 RepID=A0A654FM78_ARATH|nr:unnamed protein product [Arabidopsis thaliana]
MFSDAGRVFARRRRDIVCFSQSFRNLSRFLLHLFIIFYHPSLLSPCFHGVPLYRDNINRGFPANPVSLIRPVNSVKEEPMSSHSPNAKFESCLPKISRSLKSRTFAILVAHYLYRIPSKTNLSSPSSLMEWRADLTLKPVMMILTAEVLILNLTKPCCSFIASYPYTCGGINNISPTEATLGFSLLGLSNCCSPSSLSRPTSTNLSLSHNHSSPELHSYLTSRVFGVQASPSWKEPRLRLPPIW